MIKKKVIKQIKNKNIYAFEGGIPVFSQQQLTSQVGKQVKFLKVLFPFLDEKKWHDGGIELRPIKRDENLKYIRSYNCWRLDTKDIEELSNFLKKRVNGKPYCLYYSTYAFNNFNEITRKQKDKINNQNALFTTILPMDFDDVTYDEFEKYKEKFLELGIETIDIYTGHGIQSIVLLDRKIYDTTLLKTWTNLLLKKGFPVDGALVDAARVLRMPYSFNCKSFDKRNKYYNSKNPEAIATTDINWTEKRYNIIDIFNKINNLSDIVTKPKETNNIDILKTKQQTVIYLNEQKQEKKTHIIEVKNTKKEEVRRDYNMLAGIDKLPEALINMLYKTPEGIRNQTMLFLIPFLKNSLGLSIEKTKKVMIIWGNRCDPSYSPDFVIKEVDRLLNYNYKGKNGLYTKEMANTFGYLEFSSFNRKNKIKIPNIVFNDIANITDGAFRIYLSIVMYKSNYGLNNYSQEDICKISNIKKRTFYNHIKCLISTGYMIKIKSSVEKKKGEVYKYYLNPYISYKKGFTLIEKATVELMLQNLTDGEIKLYSYLCKMLNTENKVWASQTYLAEKIGKAGQDSVSKMTDSLNYKGFLNKNTEKIKGVLHCTYSLNY